MFEREPYSGYRRRLGAIRIKDGKLQPLDLVNPPAEIYDLMNFFEHMGYLLDGKYLTMEDVFVEFHYWILHIWADARELAKEKERFEGLIYYEHFEKMVRELFAYDRPRTGKVELPSIDDIEGFYLYEAHLSTEVRCHGEDAGDAERSPLIKCRVHNESGTKEFKAAVRKKRRVAWWAIAGFMVGCAGLFMLL